MKRGLFLYGTICFLLGTLIGGSGVVYAAYITAERCNQSIFLDGTKLELEAYTIEGSNYVKLRDVGKALDFNVYYDGNVRIERNKPYTGNPPEAGNIIPASTGANVNTSVFTQSYTREMYDALRQTIIRQGRSDSISLMTTQELNCAWEVIAAMGNWPACTVEFGDEMGEAYFNIHYPEAYQAAAAYCQPFIDGLQGLSETEKVRQIAFFIADRMEYDANASATPGTALISDGISKGRCMSYANCCQFLCNLAEIPCVLVHSATHQWNQVYVEGRWKSVDPTGADAVSLDCRNLAEVVHDNSRMVGSDYVESQPELTAFVKELLVPGSTN